MTRRTKIFLPIVVALCMVCLQSVWAQRVVVQITATDGSGPTDVLTLCTDPAGTTGVDSLSPTLQEKELPPAPQGFEVRFLSLAGYDNFGPGSYTSIHHLAFPTQTDLYLVQFKRDPSSTAIDFSWPAGLDTLGAGLWRIIPDPNELDVTVPVTDMTTGTTLHLVIPDANAHTMYIVKADGKKMRSFTPEQVANAVDSKGKEKSEKRKPYNSEGTFEFVNNTGSSVNDLHVEWSQSLVSQDANPFDIVADASSGKNSKFNYSFSSTLDSVHAGDTIKIFAHGNKGKQLVAKKFWWTLGGVLFPAKSKALGPVLPDGGGVLLLLMPNYNNIGEELYSQSAFDPTFGLLAGITTQAGVDAKLKPYFKFVEHPKWKDVTKTLNAKGTLHTGPGKCLDVFDVSLKAITKGQKSLPPTKHNNHLLASLVALKLNMAGSAFEKTPSQFDELFYIAQPGDPAAFNNASLATIAAQCDSFISCQTTHGLVATGGQWDTILTRINASCSGAFDTVSFGQPFGSKTGGATMVTGVVSLYDAGCLYRTTLSSAHSFANIKAPDLKMLEAVPQKYELLQNYPNPFNPTTTIEFNLPADAFVTIKVYNILGQEVTTLANQEMFEAGNNDVTFDATNLASGVYYYRMSVNNNALSIVKKMMLIK